MPRASYQYGTSPRKYEPEYTRKKVTKKPMTTSKNSNSKKTVNKKSIETQKTKKVQEKKNKFVQVTVVLIVFGMLLALSYREIAIMEMFNQKKRFGKSISSYRKRKWTS